MGGLYHERPPLRQRLFAQSVMSMKVLILMVTLSLALPSQGYSYLPPQSYGTFRGVIVDINGKRIRGAIVSVSGPDFKQEKKPTRDGYFKITLPAGRYEITVKKSGYAVYKLTNLEVGSSQELSHVFVLESSRVIE